LDKKAPAQNENEIKSRAGHASQIEAAWGVVQKPRVPGSRPTAMLKIRVMKRNKERTSIAIWGQFPNRRLGRDQGKSPLFK